ncbi:DJ-1/PfpI family protein [Brevundimonas sp. SL130]|uniref:DJ-1/PfpI family protein n=1 Tax=Brevundimonas sp. SL130 TaxID=2995143 RepID=UPI00226CEE9F|nr:DJ-1/PfpI family protein [Brevundimonas sp. SL130]WAC59599.1 DJ-1/PfpI family protein [Brevundimonas sp. SL130]
MKVGILVFDEVEVLDALGPFEVFSVANRVHRRDAGKTNPIFEVILISVDPNRTATARGGLHLSTDVSIETAPDLDVLIVPGGVTSEVEVNRRLIAWLTARTGTPMIASVCTGAFLLAVAGLLRGRRATTHWEDLPDLALRFPDLEVVGDVRWTGDGRVWTSAGISAGLDLSLHLVEILAGRELAVATARQMDYRWTATGTSGEVEPHA